MNLATVADEVATVLDTIAGLRVTGHPPASISPPAGWVDYPQSLDFDETYGRGMDRIRDWQVFVVVGRATERTARDRVYEYASATGSKSVKAVLEAHTYTSLATLRVASAEFGFVDVAGVDYVGVTFHLDIAAQGTT
jgi:hypothetical protein